MTLMSRWLPLNGTVVACAEPKWVEPEVVKSVCDLWTLLATIDIGNVGEWRSGSIQDEDALAIFCHL